MLRVNSLVGITGLPGCVLEANRTEVVIVAVVDESHGGVREASLQPLQGRLWLDAKRPSLTHRFVEVVGLTRDSIVVAEVQEPARRAEDTADVKVHCIF